MKWLGQHIVDFIARFRSDVYLEDLTTTTETDVLVVDSTGKISKSTSVGGDITSVTAGTGMTGGGSSDGVTLNVAAGTGISVGADSIATTPAQVHVTSLGELIAPLILHEERRPELLNSDGQMLHVDASNVNDSITSAAGTNAIMNSVTLEAPTLTGYNINVTTTKASTLYIAGPPIAGTNQTITNPYALWVDSGNVQFDGALTVGGAITGDVTGDVTGNADTVTITDKSDDVDYDVVFGNSTSALYDDTGTLTYNPNDAALTSTNFVGALTGNASGSSATVTAGTQAAITTCANLTTTGTIGTGVWNGDAIAHDYIGNDAIDGDNIADEAVDSEHYTDGSIDTAHIADDAVTFAKAVGVTPNVFGTYIKLIPSDFMANDDGGNTRLGIGYVDTAGEADYGMRVSHNDTELFAFVSIPEGMKATHVEVFGRRPKAIEVFEVQINASTLTSKGTGTCGIPADTIGDEEFAITNVESTATNLLAIEVTVTSNSADKVYGGRVKIAAV